MLSALSGSLATAGRARQGRPGRRFLILATACVLVLACAPAAHAASGIVGYFQFESPADLNTPASGAQLDNANGFDVNADGTGGAAPGDLYVAEGGGGQNRTRVQQYSTTQEYLGGWGMDVVESGPGQADEVQSVRVDATGGSFKLSFAGETTTDLAATASASEVQSALNGLGAISAGGGAVSVSGGSGDSGGTAPYLVSFDGGPLAGVDQPQIVTSDGAVPLSGGAATVSVVTIVSGANGFEICRPADGDVCKEATSTLAFPAGVSSTESVTVDQASGDLYVPGSNRINKYSATGEFLRAFGFDDVASGPGDSSVDEQQSVTVKATGGTFTLSFFPGEGAESETTAPIAYDAPPAAVQAALNDLDTIGGNYSSVTVSGGPGDETGTSPYVVTFHGLLGGDNLEQLSGGTVTLVGPEKAVEVADVASGGGYEICTPSDACKVGAAGRDSAGAFSSQAGIDVVPTGAPNAGNVVIPDTYNHRVQEFTNQGVFVRAFGTDVDATDPSTGFEVCTAVSGHTCKEGTTGAAVGEFGPNNGAALAEVDVDSTGAIYTLENRWGLPANYRVQKFTPQVGTPELSPSLFGSIGAPNGTSKETSPESLAIGLDDHVFVAKNFPEGVTSCPDGSPSPPETRIQEAQSRRRPDRDQQSLQRRYRAAAGRQLIYAAGRQLDHRPSIPVHNEKQ